MCDAPLRGCMQPGAKAVPRLLASDLVGYFPKPKNATGVSLLSGNTTEVVVDTGPREYIGFLKPNITIQLLDHFLAYPRNNLPPQFAGHLQYAEDGGYFPVIHFNEVRAEVQG